MQEPASRRSVASRSRPQRPMAVADPEAVDKRPGYLPSRPRTLFKSVWRNDPLLFQMRPEKTFLPNTRPIVLSLARSTIFSSTLTFSSSSSSVQRARPAGALEQASAINLASTAPSKIRYSAELGECLRVKAASRPSSTNRCRVTSSRIGAEYQRRRDLAVASSPRRCPQRRLSTRCGPSTASGPGVFRSGSGC